MSKLDEVVAELTRACALCDKSDKLDRERVIGRAAVKHLAAILAALGGAAVMGKVVAEIEDHLEGCFHHRHVMVSTKALSDWAAAIAKAMGETP